MGKPKRVLLLGGTTEATALMRKVTALADTPLADKPLANKPLADKLLADTPLAEIEIIHSLAGRTQQPMVAPQTRVGGFGGVAGLVDYLHQQAIAGLIDATHPFATQISAHAIAAAATVGIPHLRLLRPAWIPSASDRWVEVASNEAAAAVLPEIGDRFFLTIGRQELGTFAPLRHLWFLMRMVDAPAPDAPIPPGVVLLERGPFSVEQERSLLQRYSIGAIVSKNSGGDATYAKIIAARELQLPVVMVQRPPLPSAEQVADVDSALIWLKERILGDRLG
ncbi:MAG TPA: cobalt-precorrin-6A reductase [Chroococcidiopsis sp.]